MRNIGVDVKKPERECLDKHCPFHSGFNVRGRSFIGEVISVNVHKTATVRWPRMYYIPKYERYEKRRTTLKVHKPDCIDVKAGNTVKIMETRKISKTKNFVILEILK